MVLLLAALVAGCHSTNSVYEEKLKKDEYLKRSYPDNTPPSKETPAVNTRYYDEVIAGKVVTGMNLFEVKHATQSHPYGHRRDNAVFWCDRKPVNRCGVNCEQCTSVFLTAEKIHLLKGKGDNPVVTNSVPRQSQDTVAAFRDKPHDVVSAIFHNQVVPGMTVNDFKRIRRPAGSKTEYYCKNQRVFQSCLYDCGDCTLKIVFPDDSRHRVRTVRFRGRMDFATVVDVKESTHASRP